MVHNKKEIVEFMREGHTIKEGMDKFDKRYHSIAYICRQYGVIPLKADKEAAVGSFKILKELFNRNRTIRDISEEFNVTHQRVAQVYKSAKEVGVPGLPSRKRGIKIGK